jgi:hypothetical protein
MCRRAIQRTIVRSTELKRTQWTWNAPKSIGIPGRDRGRCERPIVNTIREDYGLPTDEQFVSTVPSVQNWTIAQSARTPCTRMPVASQPKPLVKRIRLGWMLSLRLQAPRAARCETLSTPTGTTLTPGPLDGLASSLAGARGTRGRTHGGSLQPTGGKWTPLSLSRRLRPTPAAPPPKPRATGMARADFLEVRGRLRPVSTAVATRNTENMTTLPRGRHTVAAARARAPSRPGWSRSRQAG